MTKRALFNARDKDESDFYVAEISRLILGDGSYAQVQNSSLKDAENLLLKYFDEVKARQHAKLLTLIYQEKTNINEDVLDWINSPRISGFCLMMLLKKPEYQSRFLDPLSIDHTTSISQYFPNSTHKPNVGHTKDKYNLDNIDNLPAREMFDINNYDDDKQIRTDHIDAYERQPLRKKAFIRIEDGDFINSLSTGFSIDTVIPVSSYGSHKSRHQAILKAFYDLSSAQVKCRGDNNDYRFFSLDEIILRIKFDWQQVFLHANYSWVEADNTEQVAWLHHNLVTKDAEFELPWIVTDSKSLCEALFTYLDLSFSQDPQNTAKEIEKLRKAWIRKNTNDNGEKAKNISLSSKSEIQLKELAKLQKKSERSIIKELIQEKCSTLSSKTT